MSYEKTGEPQPPRPKNSFFIFRQEWYSEQKRTNQPGILQCEFSKEAADIWKNAPQSFRDPYIQKAKLEKEEHQRRYPDYKYHPKSKMKKEQERAQAREQAKSRKRPKKTASISQPLVVASTTSTALPPPCDDFFTSGIPPAGPMGTVVPRWNDPRPIQHFRSSTSPTLDSRSHLMSNISSPLSDLVSSDSSDSPSATARFVRNFNGDYDYTTRFDGSPSFVTQVERNETPARSQLYANAETSGTSTAGVLPSSSYTPSPWEYTPQESGDIFQAGNSSHQSQMNTSRMKALASSTAEPWDTPNTDDINHDGVWSSMTSLLRDPESSPNSVGCWETLWTSDVKNEGTRTSSSAWESNPPTLPLGTMAVPVESYQVASSDTFFPSVGQYPHLPEHLSRYS